MQPIRVLVVDDSVFLRLTLSRRLAEEPDIEVAGTASDGIEALEQVRALQPDVVTLDIEMPRMNGLEALRHIMAESPRPVVMLSTLTQAGARETFRALALGAVDFCPKPSSLMRVQDVIESLTAKVRSVAGIPPGRLRALSSPPPPPAASAGLPGGNGHRLRPMGDGDVLVAVGASTGGPKALSRLFSQLPGDLQAAVAVVQHMPPHFTASLAERLDAESALHVKEAQPDDQLLVGQALLAPGGYHLSLQRAGHIALTQAPPRNHVRPAVDVTFETAGRWYSPRVVGVVLTGMGCDGTAGARRIKEQGGVVLAEAEDSCVVYGMPKCVVEAGLADRVVPLDGMAAAVVEAVDAIRKT